MQTYKKFTQTVILGIDPGYGRVGYAVLKKTPTQEEMFDYSCIETNPEEETSERILEIAQKIEKIIKKHKPEVLSIEKLFFTTNQKTALKVSEARGVIIYIAQKNGLKITEYTPLEVKTAICGYGKAPKDQVGKMVNALIKLPEPVKYDDTFDAIALCLTCVANKGYF